EGASSPVLGGVVLGQILVGGACSLFRPLRKVPSRWLFRRLALTSLVVSLIPLLPPPHHGSFGQSFRHAAAGFVLLTCVFLLLQRMERWRRDRVLLLGPWRETDNFLHALRTLPSRARPIFPDEGSGSVARSEPSLEETERLF